METRTEVIAAQDNAVQAAQIADLQARVALTPEALVSKYLKPPGSYETFPRTIGFTNQSMLTSGQVSLQAIALPQALTVTNISFYAQTTAAVGPTNWWFAICDNNFVQLRATADQLTTPWLNGALKTVPLVTPYQTAYEGLYYLAIMMAAGTVVSLTGVAASGTGFQSIAPILSCNGITGQTVPRIDGTALAVAPAGTVTRPYGFVT